MHEALISRCPRARGTTHHGNKNEWCSYGPTTTTTRPSTSTTSAEAPRGPSGAETPLSSPPPPLAPNSPALWERLCSARSPESAYLPTRRAVRDTTIQQQHENYSGRTSLARARIAPARAARVAACGALCEPRARGPCTKE
jgi:hypothetical protein